MSKLLSNDSADQVSKLLKTHPVDRPRELPPPRDLWVRGTGTGSPWDPGGDPGGTAVGSPVSSTYETYYTKCYSFECWRTGDATIAMEPGDVFWGPLTWVEWASITSATPTPAVNSSDAYVWLEIAVDTPSATMVVGSKSAMQNALDATEQLTKTVCPLAMTVWTDGVITKVKNLQCGDVKIFRAAG